MSQQQVSGMDVLAHCRAQAVRRVAARHGGGTGLILDPTEVSLEEAVVLREHLRGAVAENERLRDWLYYIEQTTADHNVLAAIELANKGEAAEFDTTGER